MTTTMALLTVESVDQGGDLLEYKIPFRNFKILNLEIFNKIAISSIEQYCTQYGISIDPKYHRDINRLYYNEMINLVLQHIINDRSTHRFILFDNIVIPAEYPQLKRASRYLITKFRNILPFQIIGAPTFSVNNTLKWTACAYERTICWARSAIDEAVAQAEQFDVASFSTKKLRKFISSNELKYLQDTLFQQLSSKLLTTK